MTVFNRDSNYDYAQQPMFFGESTSIARYESPKHPTIENLTVQALSFFWRPEEINLTTDSSQFKKLHPRDQRTFTLNLLYQAIMDTVQGSAPSEILGPICSDIGLDTWIQTWTFFETIHSRSYTHIIRNLYNNPTEIFDSVVLDDQIMARAASICKYYDELEIKWTLYSADKIRGIATEEQLYELKKAFYLCLHTINALEAIRFFVSFINTFNFFETQKVMEGNSKIMTFIARDENLHHQGTRYMIKRLQSGEEGPEWIKIAEECREEATNIFLATNEQEKEWCKYVYQSGAPQGLSVGLVSDYIDYATVPRMNELGLDSSSIVAPKRNPFPWLTKFLKSNTVQAAPQEVEIGSYLVSQIDNDITDAIMEKYKKYLRK
ncbi:NrdB aerobic NDP reductase small subunit [Acinetobacter phage Acj61]|jgi:ribonucleoside-diphosphate reductase beta chain|uniref:ribonucleoside-diphosphate reductase n=1 Tax=Acinetobacter phage Acj61 TaxID=760732 RepID=E5E4J8_9CAUD|nr:aerobic NDP reductase small subunit [Acinetobacter phage Acj61]ADG36182.1 NrdB aerobic NDP reductase small subunit [Acinetobacter phage Acj61]